MIGFLAAAFLHFLAAQPRVPIERLAGWASHGPNGGALSILATSVLDPAVVYAATSAGLFKSEDSGISWSTLNVDGDFVNHYVTWVGVAPSDPSVVYAREDTNRIHDVLTVLYRSDDAGATWQEILYLEDSFGFRNPSIDPTHAMTLYAAPVNAQALKSTDGGVTWSAILPFSASILVDPTNSSILYGNQYPDSGDALDHLQKSLDGGTT